MGRYSNHANLRDRLQAILLLEPSRSPDEARRSPKQVQVRLSKAQQAELLERYLAGSEPLNWLAPSGSIATPLPITSPERVFADHGP